VPTWTIPAAAHSFSEATRNPASALVAGAEAGDGHVVGHLVGGQDPEGDVLLAAAFDLPGGTHAQAVAVEQHAQQGLGAVSRMAVPVGPVGT
jgi:hypothetical protein